MKIKQRTILNNYNSPYLNNAENVILKSHTQTIQYSSGIIKNKPQVSFTGIGQLFTFHDAIMCLLDGIVIYTACRLEAKHSHESKDALDKKHVRGAFFDHGASISEYNPEKFYGSIHNAISEVKSISLKSSDAGILNGKSKILSTTKKTFEKILELSTEGIISKDIADKTAHAKDKFIQNSGTEGILEACSNIKTHIVDIAKSLAQNDPGFYRESIKSIKRMTTMIEKVEKKISKI